MLWNLIKLRFRMRLHLYKDLYPVLMAICYAHRDLENHPFEEAAAEYEL